MKKLNSIVLVVVNRYIFIVYYKQVCIKYFRGYYIKTNCNKISLWYTKYIGFTNSYRLGKSLHTESDELQFRYLCSF